MKVIINEDLNLDAALTVEDFTEEEKDEALATLQQCFENTARWVLSDVLNQELPETIIVEMDENDLDELTGRRRGVKLACFRATSSDTSCFVFTILEKTLMDILNHDDSQQYENTINHEMIHAADFKTLASNTRLFTELEKEILDTNTPSKQTISLSALYCTLRMCDLYRAEGIAILGEHLLDQCRFSHPKEVSLERFKTIFENTVRKASLFIQNQMLDVPILDDQTYYAAYAMAPYILLWVLNQLGLVDNTLCAKVEEGLETGQYALTDLECSSILQSALSLSLSSYIQGLLLLGDDLVPVRSFLDLCALFQKDEDLLDEDYTKKNIDAFKLLVEQKESEKAFADAMNQIMGGLMSDEEIETCYKEFCANPPDALAEPKTKEKIEILYAAFKEDKDKDRKRIAQSALTYLFDDEDIIHDDIEGLGYVDDMIVIDIALRLLNR